MSPSSLQEPDPQHGNLYCLKVPMPRVVVARGGREVPTSVSDLVANHGANPINVSVLCQTPTCVDYQQVITAPPVDLFLLLPFSFLTSFPPSFLSCFQSYLFFPLLLLTSPLPQEVRSFLMPSQGRVLIVQLVRSGGGNNIANKVTTAIADPGADDQYWPGKEVVMVVAHSGTGASDTASHYFSFFRRQGVWWKVDTATGRITREDPFVTQMGARDRLGFSINLLVFKDRAPSNLPPLLPALPNPQF